MAYFDKLDLDPTLIGGGASPEKPKPAGFLRSVADLGIEATSGVARGVKGLAGAFGADNAVAQGADAVDKFARDYLSAAAKADDQRVSEIMAAAQDAGVWEQVKAAAEAFTVKPAGMVLNAFGTSVPTIAAAMIPGVGQAGVAARLGALGAMGAAQGAGAVKGSIYEAVKAEQIKAGASESEAEAAAVRAQEYGGENTANIAGGAALGGAASATGVQPVIAKMLQRSEQVAAEVGKRGMIDRALNPEGLLARTGMGAVKEVPLEAAQGGQEQYASNIALQNEGFDTPAFRGVAGSAALEGLASAGPGAAFGALDKPRVNGEAKKPEVAEVLDPTKTIDESINTAMQTVSVPTAPVVKPRQANADAAAELALLDPADRAEALSLMQVSERRDVSGNVRRYAQNRLDALLAPYRSIPTGEATEMLPVADARELSDEERAEYANAAPYSYRRAMERGLPQPEVTEVLPTGDATEVEPIPAGDAFEEIPAPEAYETLPTGEASDLIPTADATAFEAVPAGEASELDVETIQPTDLMAKDGEPFTSKTGAQAKAYASGGGKVVAIPNHFGSGIPGYVVRPLMPGRPNNTRGTNAADVARPAGQRADDAGRGDGTAGVPDGRPGDVLAGAGSTADQSGARGGADGVAGARPTALTPPRAEDFAGPGDYYAAVREFRAANQATEEASTATSEPNPATQRAQRRAQIKRELADLQANYEKRMKKPAGAVPPGIRADALGGIARKMDKLDAELKALDAADAPPAPNTALTVQKGLTVTFGGKTYPVESVEDAQRKWIKFQESADGGAAAGVSQVGNGIPIMDGNGRLVARVAFNGRLFDAADNLIAEAPTEPADLAPGSRVTLNGTPYTVTTVNGSAVKLQGADGGTKMVAKNSRTFQAIQREPNEAARPQTQAAAGESAAPAAAPAPAAPVVVPGATGAGVEADGVDEKIAAIAAKPRNRLTYTTQGDGTVRVGPSLDANTHVSLNLTPAERKAVNRAKANAQLAETTAERRAADAELEAAVQPAIDRLVGATPNATAPVEAGSGSAAPTNAEAPVQAAPRGAEADVSTSAPNLNTSAERVQKPPESEQVARTPKAQAVKEALAGRKGEWRPSAAEVGKVVADATPYGKQYTGSEGTRQKARILKGLEGLGLKPREAQSVLDKAMTTEAQRRLTTMRFILAGDVRDAADALGYIRPADAPAKRDEYPLGKTDREDRFFGTRVRVLPELKGDEAWLGTIQMTLNGGRLFSVKRDGSDAGSIRIGGDRLEILSREDAESKPKEPTKAPASINMLPLPERWDALVAHTKQDGGDPDKGQRSYRALTQFIGRTEEKPAEIWDRWSSIIGSTELVDLTGPQVLRWMENNLPTDLGSYIRAMPGKTLSVGTGDARYWQNAQAEFERRTLDHNRYINRLEQQASDVEGLGGDADKVAESRQAIYGAKQAFGRNERDVQTGLAMAERKEREQADQRAADEAAKYKPFDAKELSKKPTPASMSGWFTANYEGKTVWTQGTILDLSGEPPHLAGYEDRRDPDRNRDGKLDVARVVPRQKGPEAVPFGYYDGEFASSAKAGVVYLDAEGKLVGVNAIFFRYFASKFKGATYYASPDGNVITVQQGGKTVGVIMPIKLGSYAQPAPTIAELRAKMAAKPATAPAAEAPAAAPAPTAAPAPQAEPEEAPPWHTPLPTAGEPSTDQDREYPTNPKSPIDFRKVVARLATDAMGAITRIQMTNMTVSGMKLWPWVLPAQGNRNGVVRLLPEDQNPPAPWQRAGTEPINVGGPRQQATNDLMAKLGSAPIIGDATQKAPKAAPTPAAQAPAGRDEQPEAQAPAKPAPKSFRKSVKVKTAVFMEETGTFSEQEIDADTAIKALEADIAELQAFRNCIAGG